MMQGPSPFPLSQQRKAKVWNIHQIVWKDAAMIGSDKLEMRSVWTQSLQANPNIAHFLDETAAPGVFVG